MARKRMIDPKLWESEQVMAMTSHAFKLYIYCINHADDDGRMRVSYSMIKSRCFPFDNGGKESVENMLSAMNDTDLVLLYSDDTDTFLQHPNWHVYQTINRPTPSNLPMYDDSLRIHGVLTPKLSKDKLNESKVRHRTHVLLRPLEYQTLIDMYGKREIDSKIEDLDNYIENKGKDPYKSHFATLKQWFKRDGVVADTKVYKTCPKGHRYTGDVCERCI